VVELWRPRPKTSSTRASNGFFPPQPTSRGEVVMNSDTEISHAFRIDRFIYLFSSLCFALYKFALRGWHTFVTPPGTLGIRQPEVHSPRTARMESSDLWVLQTYRIVHKIPKNKMPLAISRHKPHWHVTGIPADSWHS
jgi:hypothetical protein